MSSRLHRLGSQDSTLERSSSTKGPAPRLAPVRDPLIFDFKEALGLPTSPPSTVASSNTSIHSAAFSDTDLSTAPLAFSTPKILPLRPTASPQSRRTIMAHSSKAQHQCVRQCNSTCTAGDRIAERMTEYATLVKHLPGGFSNLANGLLDNCQVLALIEYGLDEAAREGQPLPLDMVMGLDKKLRAAQSAFRLLDQLIGAQLERERKSGMSRWFSGKKFADSGVEGLSAVLSRTREDLIMSAYTFSSTLDIDEIGNEVGVGCNGLTAVLDVQALRRKKDIVLSPKGNTSHPQPRSTPAHTPNHRQDEEARFPRMHLTEPLLHSRMVPEHHYPARHESHLKDSATTFVHAIGGPTSPSTSYTMSSTGSYFDHSQQQNTRHAASNLPSPYDDSRQPSMELEALCADIAELDLDSAHVEHVHSDPSVMPHRRPRSIADADQPNAHNVLVAAINAKDHKRVLQLLDRGVSPNSGTEIHAMNEALQAQDSESLRLLLLYGANPDEVDRNLVSPLVTATRKGFLSGVIALLKYGADPNYTIGPDSESPLVIATAAGNPRLAHVLLMYGAKANQATSTGNTLLINSINAKTPKKLVEMLLGCGADPDEKNREGTTALFVSIQAGRSDIVRSLIEHGANPNLPGPKHMLWPSTYQPACLQILLDSGADYKKAPGIMELATSINNIESIRILLKAKVDPNAKKDGVYTPLCTSIRDDRHDIFHLLLANGADPNIPASEYPAFKCLTHHREHFLPHLVKAGVKLTAPKGILETAVTSDNAAGLQWLLENGSLQIDERSQQGHTALTSAIRDGKIDFVKTLLSAGANPNHRGEDWPVCMAVRHPEILRLVLTVLREPRAFKGIMEMAVVANKLESVQLLLAAGVSVEDRNGGVFSPLTSAIRERRPEIVKFLIEEAGADVNAPGEHLPIVKSLRRCVTVHTEIIDMLLAKGADPNKMYRGWNGIMQALENGDAAMLRKLCEKSKVDTKCVDGMGRNVVEIAMSRDWVEAVDILKKNLAR